MHVARPPKKQSGHIAQVITLAIVCTLALAAVICLGPPVRIAYALATSDATESADGEAEDVSTPRISKGDDGLEPSGGIRVSIVDRETRLAQPLGAARLSGAKIAIVLVSPKSITVGKKRYGAGDVVKRITTKANGRAETNSHALPFGTYRLKMQKAPRGYRLDKTWKPTVKIRDDGKMHLVKVLALQAIRGDARLDDVFGDVADRSGPTAFLVTGKTSGEQHVVLANGGRIDTSAKAIAHTKDTNANDALIASSLDAAASSAVSEDSAPDPAGFVHKASLTGHLAFPTLGASPRSANDTKAEGGIVGHEATTVAPEASSNTDCANDIFEQETAPDKIESGADDNAGATDDRNETDETPDAQNADGNDAIDSDANFDGVEADEGFTSTSEDVEGDEESSGDNGDEPETPSVGTDSPGTHETDESSNPPGADDEQMTEPVTDKSEDVVTDDAGDSPDGDGSSDTDDFEPPNPAGFGVDDIAAAIRDALDAESVALDDAEKLASTLGAASACEDVPFVAHITIDGKANDVHLIATPQEDGSVAVRDALTDDELVFIDVSGSIETGTVNPDLTGDGETGASEDSTGEGHSGTEPNELHPEESPHDATGSTQAETTDTGSKESPDEGAGNILDDQPDTRTSDEQAASSDSTGSKPSEAGLEGASSDADMTEKPDASRKGTATGGNDGTSPGNQFSGDGESATRDDGVTVDDGAYKATAQEDGTAADESEANTVSVDNAEPNLRAGIWFSGSADTQTAPDDALGALPYDTYTFQEIRSATNAGMELTSFEVEIGDEAEEQTRPSTTAKDNAENGTPEHQLAAAKPAQARAGVTGATQRTSESSSGNAATGKGGLFDQTGNLLGGYWWAFALIGALGICSGAYAASLRKPEYTSWKPTSAPTPN